MVLKIELDRSVRPSAGHGSTVGRSRFHRWSVTIPVRSNGPENGQTGIGLVKLVVRSANQMNRTVLSKPCGSIFLFLFSSIVVVPLRRDPHPIRKALLLRRNPPSNPARTFPVPTLEKPCQQDTHHLCKASPRPCWNTTTPCLCACWKIFSYSSEPLTLETTPSPVLEPLALEKLKNFSLFARQKPPTRRWKCPSEASHPTLEMETHPPKPHCLLLSYLLQFFKIFLIIFYLISFLFISFHIYYFFIL